MIHPHPFGQAVSFYREQKGWTRYALAQAAGRQSNEIQRLEVKKGSVTVDTLIWVAKALDLHPSELMTKMVEIMEREGWPI